MARSRSRKKTSVEPKNPVRKRSRHPGGVEILLDVTRSLTERLDIQYVLQNAAKGAVRLIGLDTSAVYLLESETLILQATEPPLPPGFPDGLRVASLADHPHIGKAVRLKQPVLVPDITRENLTPAERAVTEQRNLRTVLYIPLIIDEQVIGSFIVGSIGRPVPVSKSAMNLSLTLGNLSALALRNAQLFKEGQDYANRLETSLNLRKQEEKERLLLEDSLHQAQKMESIGRLAGGISHDYNNMLCVILANAEIGIQQSQSNPELRLLLEQIRDAAQRSTLLTKQLLTFARKQTVHPQVLNLNDRIAGLTDMLNRLMKPGIELVWQPDPTLRLIKIDPVQWDQVIMNLCVNASDALNGPGKIVIRTRNSVPSDSAESFVVVSVEDNGPGMEPEVLEKIFEPFFTTKPAGKGTGLGLATVYGIVQQNKGRIEVTSRPGQGTVFSMFFPTIDG